MKHPILKPFTITLRSVALALAAPLVAATLPATALQQIGTTQNATEAPKDFIRHHDLAVNPDGRHAVMWLDGRNGQCCQTYRVRLFDAAGAPVGGERLLHDPIGTFVDGVNVGRESVAGLEDMAVAMNAGGDAALVYKLRVNNGTLDAYEGLFLKVLDQNGQPRTDLLSVTQEGDDPAFQPGIAMSTSGNMVITWSYISSFAGGANYDIRARQFASNGQPVGAEFTVNASTMGTQDHPAVAMAPDGSWAITWASRAPGSSMPAIRARRYSATGVASGDFLIGSAVVNAGAKPDIAYDPARRGFVVTWVQDDGERRRVFYRRLGNTGTIGAAVQVDDSATPAPIGATSSVGCTVYGVCSFGWVQSQGVGVLIRSMESDDVFTGPSVLASSGFGPFATIAVDGDGEIVLARQRDVSSPSNPQPQEIQVTRFQGPSSTDLALTVTESADPAPANAPFTYTLLTSNLRAPEFPTNDLQINQAVGAATGVRVSPILPKGAKNVVLSGSGWTCTVTPASCRYNTPLRAGVQAPPITLSLTTPTKPGKTMKLSATLTADQGDGNTVNNQVQAKTRLQ